MRITLKAGARAAAVLALVLPLVGCTVRVTDGGSERDSNVDIRTPAGRLSVHQADDDASETGLPIYPHAWPSQRHDDRHSANVNISTAWFGVNVVAAEFETDDSPDQVTRFYRDAMEQYGTVTECRGDVDFKGRRGAEQPVCRDDGSHELKLVTGTKHRRRVVAVKPHGEYTEFALVYVDTRGR